MPDTIHLSRWIFDLAIILYFGIIIAAVVVVLRENRNPIRALSWVIALIFLPGIGLVFYLFFGRSLRGEMMTQQNKRRMMHNRRFQTKLKDLNLPKDSKHLVSLGTKLSGFPYTTGNSIEIFIDGPSKFEKCREVNFTAILHILR